MRQSCWACVRRVAPRSYSADTKRYWQGVLRRFCTVFYGFLSELRCPQALGLPRKKGFLLNSSVVEVASKLISWIYLTLSNDCFLKLSSEHFLSSLLSIAAFQAVYVSKLIGWPSSNFAKAVNIFERANLRRWSAGGEWLNSNACWEIRTIVYHLLPAKHNSVPVR